MSRLLVNTTPRETIIAVTQGNDLTDLVIQPTDGEALLHRIYKGVVKNVVAALDAAFVDIGTGENGYLPLLGGKSRDLEGHKISVGARVLVQVTKEARGTKGPMLTTKPSLAGRYAVLLTKGRYVGVSKQIQEAAERERLRGLVGAQLGSGDEACGFILRTAAQGVDAAELTHDLAFLRRTWESIRRRAKIASAPACLYREADIVLRAARDYVTPSTEQIITNDRAAYERLVDLVSEQPQVEVSYVAANDLLTQHGIQDAITPLLERRVEVPGGAYIVIDPTEALTAIDVNSGTFRSGHGRDDLALRVNLAAAQEVARQIRLRNIGGIIIVDFIDMPRKEDRELVLAALRTAVKEDRVRTTVVEMTALGLVEMTRHKTGPTLQESRYMRCPECAGTGYVMTAAAIVEQITEELRQKAQRGLADRVLVQVHPAVADYLREANLAAQWQARFHKEFIIATHQRPSRTQYQLAAAPQED
ncbi:Rne/Rng family ribonuclease [Negativicoccus succinicivorans]|uniref:Rne/Rng family ribonuclease n=1 Tax=Negativicoccus succinicivorans TaxID=620903 RepID=UPI0029073CD6|nr:Rne/Rng family ribonuclease [Negativicoccus succinicivorans]MDU5233242.1 Rne/Rng family ribonuclease [Negativicoccus succinicivorans]